MITEITLIVCPKDEHDENILKSKAVEALAKKTSAPEPKAYDSQS